MIANSVPLAMKHECVHKVGKQRFRNGNSCLSILFLAYLVQDFLHLHFNQFD